MNEDLALLWERVLSGSQVDCDEALWRRLQSSQEPAAREMLATVRMHRLLTVALAGQSAQTIARHAIELATVARPVQRQRAVGATMHRLRRHRWRRYAFMATAAALVIGVGFWSTVRASSTSPVLIVTAAPAGGTVCDSQGQPLAGSGIPVGGSLRGNGRWELSSPDRRVTLSASGASRLAMLDATTVRLEQGELRVSATSGGSDLWRFVTPHAEARIIGTRFTLTVTDDATGLAVTNGVVSFLPNGGEAFPVAAGASSLAECQTRPLWLAAHPSETVPDGNVGTARILPGPDQRSGFCGEVLPQEDGTNDVAVAFAAPEGRPLAELPPGSRIVADLWLDPSTTEALTVQGWDLDAGQNYQIHMPDPPRGRWFSLNVPIADLAPVFPERAHGPLRRPRALMFVINGDQTGALWVARARLLAP